MAERMALSSRGDIDHFLDRRHEIPDQLPIPDDEGIVARVIAAELAPYAIDRMQLS